MSGRLSVCLDEAWDLTTCCIHKDWKEHPNYWYHFLGYFDKKSTLPFPSTQNKWVIPNSAKTNKILLFTKRQGVKPHTVIIKCSYCTCYNHFLDCHYIKVVDLIKAPPKSLILADLELFEYLAAMTWKVICLFFNASFSLKSV